MRLLGVPSLKRVNLITGELWSTGNISAHIQS